MASIKKIDKLMEAHEAGKKPKLTDVMILTPEQLLKLDIMLDKEMGLVKIDGKSNN